VLWIAESKESRRRDEARELMTDGDDDEPWMDGSRCTMPPWIERSTPASADKRAKHRVVLHIIVIRYRGRASRTFSRRERFRDDVSDRLLIGAGEERLSRRSRI